MRIPLRLKSTLTVALVALAVMFVGACGRDKRAAPAEPVAPATSVPEQVQWPQHREQDGRALTVYEPQVESWDYKTIKFVAAVAVAASGTEQPVYGVAAIEARTHTDFEQRTVLATDVHRELRFPTVSAQEQARLGSVVEALMPTKESVTVSLDLVLAYVRATSSQQPAVPVNLEPPRIFYSQEPAILVMFMGPPKLKPIGGTALMFVANTNWDVLYEPTSSRYYLLNGDSWLTASNAAAGPWVPTTVLPASFSTLPSNANWAEVKQHIPGSKPSNANPAEVKQHISGTKPSNPVVVFSTTEPAEMILTDGDPTYVPIPGTQLLYVNNSDSVLLLHAAQGEHFYLVAGRWFRATRLTGPWSAATENLPDDFLNIPADHPLGPIRASVPGTDEANDAILLASVPVTQTVDIRQAPPAEVAYEGAPAFKAIADTSVEYAMNTPNDLFLVDGRYYWAYQGIWYCGSSPHGAWTVCTSVPQQIYQIPPSHSKHSVTYVHIYESTPTTVTTGYTSGYKGEYVAAGVLLFGVGMLVGAALEDDDYYYGWPPAPALHPYGAARHYSYAYGGYFGAAHAYGPFGSAGAWRAYNPATGTYARGGYASGPYGAAGWGAAYNPYTGGAVAGRGVATPFGSAGGYAAYNPYTGVRSRGAYATNGDYSRFAQAGYNPRTGMSGARAGYSTPEGSVTRGYVRQGDDWVRGGQRSNSEGTVGGIQTSGGASLVGIKTDQGQAAFGRTAAGDVYVGHDGNVYKKDESGNWQQNTGDGWQDVDAPTPHTRTSQSARREISGENAGYRQTTVATSSGVQTSQRTATSIASPRATQRPAARVSQSSTVRPAAPGDVQSRLDRDAMARQRGEQLALRSRSFQESGFGADAVRQGRRR